MYLSLFIICFYLFFLFLLQTWKLPTMFLLPCGTCSCATTLTSRACVALLSSSSSWTASVLIHSQSLKSITVLDYFFFLFFMFYAFYFIFYNFFIYLFIFLFFFFVIIIIYFRTFLSFQFDLQRVLHSFYVFYINFTFSLRSVYIHFHSFYV